MLEFQHNAVQDVLRGFEHTTPGKEDMDLYNELVECAGAEQRQTRGTAMQSCLEGSIKRLPGRSELLRRLT